MAYGPGYSCSAMEPSAAENPELLAICNPDVRAPGGTSLGPTIHRSSQAEGGEPLADGELFASSLNVSRRDIRPLVASVRRASEPHALSRRARIERVASEDKRQGCARPR